MAEALPGTASAGGALARIRYNHDAMIDVLIEHPWIKQKALAAHFGYSEAWVSRILCSDAFQARLALRKSELIDPTIMDTIETRFKALAMQSIDVIANKLELSGNPDTALKALDIAQKALGFGARASNVNVQQNFVVAMPAKAASSADWASEHAGARPAGSLLSPVDVTPRNPLVATVADVSHPDFQPMEVKTEKSVNGMPMLVPDTKGME